MGEMIVVLVPVYLRPWRVEPLLESFQQSDAPEARLLFIASPEDKQERAALDGIEHLVVPFRRLSGDWAKKINYGYRNTTEPWILCAADDVHFHRGWSRTLLHAFSTTKKRVIGTNDLNPHASNRGVYSPHPLVARSYADELGTIDGPGAIFSEAYDHNYPDRELAATAIWRREWHFSQRAVIEHLHPGFTETRTDKTYRIGARKASRDQRLYESRMKRILRSKP